MSDADRKKLLEEGRKRVKYQNGSISPRSTVAKYYSVPKDENFQEKTSASWSEGYQ